MAQSIMKIISLICCLVFVQFDFAQSPHTAQLKQELLRANDDTCRVLLMSSISSSYRFSKFDSSLWYGQQGFELAKHIHYIKGEGRCLANIARILAEQGNTPVALNYNLEALKLNEVSNDWDGKIQTLNSIGLMFNTLGDFSQARSYFFNTINIYDKKRVKDDYALIVAMNNLGVSFYWEKQMDSSKYYLNKCFEILKHSNFLHMPDHGNPSSFVIREMGRFADLLGNDKEAFLYYQKSIAESKAENDLRSMSLTYQYLADWFAKYNQPDSSIDYAVKSLQAAESLPLPYGIIIASAILKEYYKLRGNKDSTLKYMTLEIAARDSLFNPNRIREIELLNFTEQQKVQQVQEDKERFNNKVKLYASLSGIVILLIGSFLLYRNNRDKQKAYQLLEQKNQEINAQKKEAQIESALERIRSRSLAMHQSDELREVISLVLKNLQGLGIDMEKRSVGILTFEKGSKACEQGSKDHIQWVASPEHATTVRCRIPYFDNVILRDMWEARKHNTDFYCKSYLREEKDSLFKYFFQLPDLKNLPEKEKNYLLEAKFYEFSVAFQIHSAVAIGNFTNIPLTSHEQDILKRFAIVFDQAYIRFLDLQKAEEQAREAQIEAVLERVRSRSLAMHHTEELKEVITVVLYNLQELGLAMAKRSAIILTFEQNSKDHIQWVASPEHASPVRLRVPYADTVILKDIWNARERQIAFHSKSYSVEEKNSAFEYFFQLPDLIDLPEKERNYLLGAEFYEFSLAFQRQSAVGIANFTNIPLTSHEQDILKRFAIVFEQAYIRFLDLQKAEDHAEEAKIEASLERVRTSAMSMHTSTDVGNATAVLFKELDQLGISALRCGVIIIDPSKTMVAWTTGSGKDGGVQQTSGMLDMTMHPLLEAMFEAWDQKDPYFCYELDGSDLQKYYEALSRTPGYTARDISVQFIKQYAYSFYFQEGGLYLFTRERLGEKHITNLQKFAGVFGLTYRRYQDLKEAEAQAREAVIEAALEKVRGKAMAMQNSNDLSITVSTAFSELRKLGIKPIRFGVGLLNPESRRAQLYSATPSVDGDSLALTGWAKMQGHPVLENIYESWMKSTEYFPELSGEQLKSYYKKLSPGLNLSTNWKDTEKQYGHFFPFSAGFLGAWSDVSYNDSEIKILRRFASIINLTFRRYMELQKSEAAAKEAIRQATLDRIRAEIASMRTTKDLESITPLIWNELVTLGVSFIRCGVFIMDDTNQLIHTFLSTPDGRGIAAFHMAYSTSENISDVINYWRKKETYTRHWDEKAFREFAESLANQGAIKASQQYLSTLPSGGLNLHFVPFNQGMLYVGNTAPLGEEEIILLQSLANAFSTAYARYEDFNRLEAAKKQVDNTLTELKQTQQQLVQSEKMASLGELTAGIAHEIQNPLNFINNFSEVNKELLAEMKDEMNKGNLTEANTIADDVIDNEQKINHHGKRADAIVKGMLQHSRASSEKKELTDINSLADEFLRLSYHGLRAKNKDFNADFKTDFDQSMEKIKAIPQDIGRVLLNLYNNAFYAVNEKRKQSGEGYVPVVALSTRKENGKVIIIVKDNGKGIPQKVVDKIFQPFFTTKPAGEGTGLGLSLSYDIVKAHGGEMKVETKEGEGAAFIIQLPCV
ncbi:MAG: hypothetical protein NVSMB67_24720 [Flavisolibacter sp.]